MGDTLNEIEARVRRSIEVVHLDNNATKQVAEAALDALAGRVRELEEAAEWLFSVNDAAGAQVAGSERLRTALRGATKAASGEERHADS